MRMILLIFYTYCLMYFNCTYANDVKSPKDFLYIKDEKWNEILNKEININLRNVNLKKALTYISKRTGANIYFGDTLEENDVDKKELLEIVENIEKVKVKKQKHIDIVFNKIKVRDLIFYICQQFDLVASWYYFTKEQKQKGCPQAIRLIEKK